ncbi:hypothetical protein V8E36_004461 [Tilletia maclaganii]
MSSFAPTLIAPAPCRPIPLVRNRQHQQRYQRLSGGSSIGSTAGIAAITTPPAAAVSAAASGAGMRSMSPHYQPYPCSSSSASANLAAAASAASAFVFPHRTAASNIAEPGRRASSSGWHSRPGSQGLTSTEEKRESISFLSATSPASALSTLEETTDHLRAPSRRAAGSDGVVDHELTPTRKLMQSFSASSGLAAMNGCSSSSSPGDATPQPSVMISENQRSSSPFLEVPASSASLMAATHSSSSSSFSAAQASPAISDVSTFSGGHSSSSMSLSAHTPSGSTASAIAMSPENTLGPGTLATPLHPSLIPPSPIPRRLTRNPFARSVSQGYGLGVSDNPAWARSNASNPNLPTRSAAPLPQISEPAPRFSLDTIGIGLMDISFDLDSLSADDGGRELLRVERERRKRSFEMHD